MSAMMSTYQRRQWEMRRLDADRRREDNRDVNTSWHESGHVVCGYLLRLNPTKATIVGGDGYSGLTHFGETDEEMTDHELAYARAVVCMAGVEAQRLFGGYDGGGEQDAGVAAVVLGAVCRSEAEIDAVVESARGVARAMLRTNFITLCEVAIALIDRRSLDEAAIEEIIAANSDVGDDDDDDDGEVTLAEFIAGRGSRAMSPRLVKYRGL
jgi:hypothetical protein